MHRFPGYKSTRGGLLMEAVESAELGINEESGVVQSKVG